MKYKPVPTTCSCGKPRRPGQRDCKACHANAGRRLRQEASEETSAGALMRTMRKVAKPRGRKMPPELEAKLRTLAMRVAQELEQFNQMDESGAA